MNKPWPVIVAQYAECTERGAEMQAMLALVQRIAGSQLAVGLFAWTSMFDLCITQTAVTYPYDGPYLKISPRQNGRIEFRYLDTRAEDKQWVRVVDPVDTIPRLLKFLHQLHWFPEGALNP